MKKQNSFVGFLFVGFGLYFLLRQFNISYFSSFYSWPTILIIVGVAFLLHSYTATNYSNIFTGSLILGIGIHYHGLNHYNFWTDHWGVYPLIIGISLLLHYQKTKVGLVPGLIFICTALFSFFSSTRPGWFSWIRDIFLFLERFWPLILIGFGIYILTRKK